MRWWKDVKRRRAEERERTEAVLTQHRELLARTLEDADDSTRTALLALREEAPDLHRRLDEQTWELVKRFAEDRLADEVLTEAEEESLYRAMEAAGISAEELLARDRDVFVRLVISRVNDGRLPTMDVPVLLKSGEVGHQVMEARLLKEVTVREYQGGYRGVSLRIAKGVRYHTGGMRGRSVVVGTETQVDDVGELAITSQRAVFKGQRRSIEFAYSKLVSVDVDGDVLRLHCSNRKNTPALLVGSGHIAGAIITAAAQRTL